MMCGCSSDAASWISRRKRSVLTARGHFGRENLHDDAPPERRVLRHEDAAHSPAAELALEDVRARQRFLQLAL